MATHTEKCAHNIVLEAEIVIDEFVQFEPHDGDCTPYCVTLTKRCDDCGDDYFGEDSLSGIWAADSSDALDQALEQLSIDGQSFTRADIARIFEE